MKLKKKYLVIIILLAVSVFIIASFYFGRIKPKQDRENRGMEQYSKAYHAFRSGKYRDAINSYTFALMIGLDDYLSFYSYQNIGDARAFLGEYEQAIEAYNKALNTPIPEGFNANSRYAFVHNHIGNVYFDEKKYVEAISEYNRAIQIDSTYYYLHSNIGKAYANLGQREQAIQHCEMAIEKSPNSHGAYQALGDVYSILNEHELAVDSYNKSLAMLENSKSSPEIQAIYKSPLYTGLGYSYVQLNNLQQAIEAYKSAIKENHEKPYPYYALAKIYLYQGDKQTAMKLYDSLKELDNALSVELLDEIHKAGFR
jgi:tetratricopeptide (TPR) repeat protein